MSFTIRYKVLKESIDPRLRGKAFQREGFGSRKQIEIGRVILTQGGEGIEGGREMLKFLNVSRQKW